MNHHLTHDESDDATRNQSTSRGVAPRGNDPTHRFDDIVSCCYEAVANDLKYRHFIRIPRRIARCLDYFGVSYDRVSVERRLRAYYLFIGVIDNAIDSGHAQVGQMVLRQLELTQRPLDHSSDTSEIALVTEGLKLQISNETYPDLLRILRALSESVEDEPKAGSMTEFIEVRKRVGRLTARASYVLIRPLLCAHSGEIGRFMQRVGEIGCLVDSVIDLRADRRSGLLKVVRTPRDFIRLLACTLKNGATLSIEHPRLIALFIEAVVDNVLDRLRDRDGADQLQSLPKNAAANTT